MLGGGRRSSWSLALAAGEGGDVRPEAVSGGLARRLGLSRGRRLARRLHRLRVAPPSRPDLAGRDPPVREPARGDRCSAQRSSSASARSRDASSAPLIVIGAVFATSGARAAGARARRSRRTPRHRRSGRGSRATPGRPACAGARRYSSRSERVRIAAGLPARRRRRRPRSRPERSAKTSSSESRDVDRGERRLHRDGDVLVQRVGVLEDAVEQARAPGASRSRRRASRPCRGGRRAAARSP